MIIGLFLTSLISYELEERVLSSKEKRKNMARHPAAD